MRARVMGTAAVAVLAAALSSGAASAAKKTTGPAYDLLITGGTIYDGSGGAPIGPWPDDWIGSASRR